MSQTSLQDALVQIVQSQLSNTSGSFTHTGDLAVSGTISADSIHVKNLITENGNPADLGNWVTIPESDLNGKGFSWTYGLGSTQLMYRTGNRLWTNANIDLLATASYNIDNIPVLSAGQLGSTITKSNLNTVGTLTKLNVSGDVQIGDFVFVNSTFNRIGIGTDEPSGSLSVLDNNVELVMSSPGINVGCIGTYSNHDLEIITDNLARITIKNSGEVSFSNNVTINGTLTATTVVTDNRVDRTHPLQFSATKDSSVYGLGLVWSGTGNTKQLVVMANPDRIWSSEDFGLDNEKCFYIGNHFVLSASALGANVITSNLTQVGTLNSLTVSGNTTLGELSVKSITVDGGIVLNQTGFDAGYQVGLTVQNKEIIYGDVNQVNIGDASLQTKPIKVFGKLSVGINNPDPTVNFSVNGDVSIGGKKITSGAAAPIVGIFRTGDICWNTNPQPNSFIGWVCITEGDPGQWLGFGMIAAQ